MSDISRRTTLKGAAWSAPVLVIGAQASAATTSRVVEPKLWWNNTYASTQGHQYADNPRSYSFLIGNSLQYGNRASGNKNDYGFRIANAKWKNPNGKIYPTETTTLTGNAADNPGPHRQTNALGKPAYVTEVASIDWIHKNYIVKFDTIEHSGLAGRNTYYQDRAWYDWAGNENKAAVTQRISTTNGWPLPTAVNVNSLPADVVADAYEKIRSLGFEHPENFVPYRSVYRGNFYFNAKGTIGGTQEADNVAVAQYIDSHSETRTIKNGVSTITGIPRVWTYYFTQNDPSLPAGKSYYWTSAMWPFGAEGWKRDGYPIPADWK